MPKELHEISQFVTGTMTTPTERDISDDAASDSLNIDPVAQDGLLQGIPKNKDVQYDSGGGDTNVNVNADNMAVVTDDTIKKLVYFDDSDDKFKKNIMKILNCLKRNTQKKIKNWMKKRKKRLKD